jgi:hypothetical protein
VVSAAAIGILAVNEGSWLVRWSISYWVTIAFVAFSAFYFIDAKTLRRRFDEKPPLLEVHVRPRYSILKGLPTPRKGEEGFRQEAAIQSLSVKAINHHIDSLQAQVWLDGIGPNYMIWELPKDLWGESRVLSNSEVQTKITLITA